jgi:hypothetical protein
MIRSYSCASTGLALPCIVKKCPTFPLPSCCCRRSSTTTRAAEAAATPTAATFRTTLGRLLFFPRLFFGASPPWPNQRPVQSHPGCVGSIAFAAYYLLTAVGHSRILQRDERIRGPTTASSGAPLLVPPRTALCWSPTSWRPSYFRQRRRPSRTSP